MLVSILKWSKFQWNGGTPAFSPYHCFKSLASISFNHLFLSVNYTYTCNIQVCKKKCSFVKLQESLPFLRKKCRFATKNVVWTLLFWMDFAPGALKFLCENTMKFDLPIMLLECSTNLVNWRRTEFVHVDMCILLKLVYSWKRIRPTTGFEFVSATCHSVLPETCVEWWPTWSCQHAQDQLFWS